MHINTLIRLISWCVKLKTAAVPGDRTTACCNWLIQSRYPVLKTWNSSILIPSKKRRKFFYSIFDIPELRLLSTTLVLEIVVLVSFSCLNIFHVPQDHENLTVELRKANKHLVTFVSHKMKEADVYTRSAETIKLLILTHLLETFKLNWQKGNMGNLAHHKVCVQRNKFQMNFP